MSKELNNNKLTGEEEILDIVEKKKREIAKLEGAAKAKCSHYNKKGKLCVEQLPNGLYKCTKCHQIFSGAPVKQDGLKAALKAINSVVNQLKMYSDPVDEAATIEALGELLNTATSVFDTYNKGVNEGQFFKHNNGGKKDKKDKKHSSGSYGWKR